MKTLETTNQMTLGATQTTLSAWDKGLAKGLAQQESVFDKGIEKRWMDQWLLESGLFTSRGCRRCKAQRMKLWSFHRECAATRQMR